MLNVLNSKTLKKYLQNTSWGLTDKFVRLGVNFFIVVFVARYLGTEKFGAYSYVQSIIALITPFVMLGFEEILVRDFIKEDKCRENLILTSFLMRLMSALIIFFVALVTIDYFNFNEDEKGLFKVMILTVFCFPFWVFDSFFQSQMRLKLSSISNLVGQLIVSGLKIALIYYDRSLFFFGVAFFLEYALISSMLTYFYLRKYGKIKFSAPRGYGRLINDALPLILSSIMITIYMRIDQVMLRNLSSVSEVGIYSVSVKISESWYFIPVIICASLFPVLISAKEISNDNFIKKYASINDILALLSFVVAIVVSFLSEFIILILFGEEYAQASQVLTIHIWTGVFVAIGILRSKYLIILNQQKIGFYCLFLGAVINLVLNFIFIPKYGAIGAAIATLVSQFFANYLTSFFYPTLRPSFKVNSVSLLTFGLGSFRLLKKNFND